MSHKKGPNKERIALFTSASVADPDWVFAWEDEETIQHSDFFSLVEKVFLLACKRAFEDGKAFGETTAREVMGISSEDFAKAWLRSKKKA